MGTQVTNCESMNSCGLSGLLQGVLNTLALSVVLKQKLPSCLLIIIIIKLSSRAGQLGIPLLDLGTAGDSHGTV